MFSCCSEHIQNLQRKTTGTFCFKYSGVDYFTSLSLLVQLHSSDTTQLPNSITAFLPIFTKFLGSPWCALSKKAIVTYSISHCAVKQAREALFFNTSSSWQDWTKLHYYVLQCKKTAWAIPAVSYTHFFREQGSLFLHYHCHQLPGSFFQHNCFGKANCGIKYGISAHLSSG